MWGAPRKGNPRPTRTKLGWAPSFPKLHENGNQRMEIEEVKIGLQETRV